YSGSISYQLYRFVFCKIRRSETTNYPIEFPANAFYVTHVCQAEFCSRVIHLRQVYHSGSQVDTQDFQVGPFCKQVLSDIARPASHIQNGCIMRQLIAKQVEGIVIKGGIHKLISILLRTQMKDRSSKA